MLNMINTQEFYILRQHLKVLITECIRDEDKKKLNAIEKNTYNPEKLDDLIIDFFNDFERIKEI